MENICSKVQRGPFPQDPYYPKSPLKRKRSCAVTHDARRLETKSKKEGAGKKGSGGVGRHGPGRTHGRESGVGEGS